MAVSFLQCFLFTDVRSFKLIYTEIIFIVQWKSKSVQNRKLTSKNENEYFNHDLPLKNDNKNGGRLNPIRHVNLIHEKQIYEANKYFETKIKEDHSF